MQTILTHSYPDTGRYAGKLRVVDELGNAEPWRPFVVDIARPTPTPTPPQIVPSWGFSLSCPNGSDAESITFPRRYGGRSAVGMGAWSLSASASTDYVGAYWNMINVLEEGMGTEAMLTGWLYWYEASSGIPTTGNVIMADNYVGDEWEATFPALGYGERPPAFEARIEDRILEINEPWAITKWTGDAEALIDPQHFNMSYMSFSDLTELNRAVVFPGNLRVQFDGYTIGG